MTTVRELDATVLISGVAASAMVGRLLVLARSKPGVRNFNAILP